MENPPEAGILEEFRLEFLACWQKLPNKAFFFLLLGAWLMLFQFFGNPTLGHINSPSLMRWMLDAYSPTGDYLSGEEAHAVIMPFVVLALFWWKRRRLMATPARVWSPALLLIAFALLLHVAAFTVQQPKASVVALFVGIYGLIGLAWGSAWMKASFFPFCLLAFCMPLGDQAQLITTPLRLLVARLVAGIAHLGLAPDLVRQGSQLIGGGGTFNYDVAPACSGIRSLVTLLAFSSVYAFISFSTSWKRWVIVLAGVPLAVIGNVARICFTVAVAEVLGQNAGKTVEQNFGLVTFAVAIGLLLALGHWLREPESPSAGAGPRGDSGNELKAAAWPVADQALK
jgi:exosortase